MLLIDIKYKKVLMFRISMLTDWMTLKIGVNWIRYNLYPWQVKFWMSLVIMQLRLRIWRNWFKCIRKEFWLVHFNIHLTGKHSKNNSLCFMMFKIHQTSLNKLRKSLLLLRLKNCNVYRIKFYLINIRYKNNF